MIKVTLEIQEVKVIPEPKETRAQQVTLEPRVILDLKEILAKVVMRKRDGNYQLTKY